MLVIGIFSFFSAVGDEVEFSVFIVHPRYPIRMESTACQLSFQSSVCSVQVEMSPTVTLRPEDDFAPVIDKIGTGEIDVGIASLLNHHFLLIGGKIPADNIHSLQIPGSDRKIEGVRISQPSHWSELIVP